LHSRLAATVEKNIGGVNSQHCGIFKLLQTASEIMVILILNIFDEYSKEFV